MVLAGPTAVGKTELAIRVARDLQTEIVGADAFQIYQGLDILTGKPAPSQLIAIRHHLIGLLPLTELCDAHRYALLASQAIAALNERGITPLVVGGTGFYLQALEEGLPQWPAANLPLRAELNCLSTTDLLRDLTARDAVASERIDRQNRRRIIRALEVCLLSGKRFSSFSVKTVPDPAIARIVLELPRPVLITKINRRVDAMFEHRRYCRRGCCCGGHWVNRRESHRIPTDPFAAGWNYRLFRAAAMRSSNKRETYCKTPNDLVPPPTPYQLVPAESSVDFIIATFRRPAHEKIGAREVDRAALSRV